MALGAIKALGDRAGKDVVVIGFDGTPDGLKAIADGTMTATVAQQPEELGRVAMEQAIAAIKGETPDTEVPVEVRLVTSDNVDEFTE
jgi:ribose transport system substrate-binding protein